MGRAFRWFLGLTGLLLTIMVIARLAGLGRAPSVPSRAVLQLVLDGPVREAPALDFGVLLGDAPSVHLRAITESLRRAATDPRIVGLLIDVRTPELGLAQLQELEEAAAVFRKSGKWTGGFLETAGEGGRSDGIYALAALADEVVLAPPGALDLTGLRAETFFLAGMLEKLGVDVHFEKRGKYKTAPNLFTERAFTPEHHESLKAVVDDLQRALLEHVAARRNRSLPEVQAWLDEGPFDSATAKQRGLVDRLAYRDEVDDTCEGLAKSDEPFISVAAYWQALEAPSGAKHVALVYGSGAIHRGSSDDGPSGGDGMGSDTLAEALREARLEKPAALVFRVDSPGGSYVASDLIRREVQLTREAGIPVVVSMGNVAASGGYFVSLDATKIVAEPTTITGSIGVYAGMLRLDELLQKLGIAYGAYDAAPRAGVWSTLGPIDDTRVRGLRSLADRVYADFTQKVADKRKQELAHVQSVAQGRIWSGKAALGNGLVDELGGLERAITVARELAQLDAGEAVEVRVWPREDSPLHALRTLLKRAISADSGQVELRTLSRFAPLHELVRLVPITTGEIMLAVPAMPRL